MRLNLLLPPLFTKWATQRSYTMSFDGTRSRPPPSTAEVPPERVVDQVVGDAVAERDPVGEVGGEGVAGRVVHGDALDDRSPGAAFVGVEVDRVAAEDLLVVALPGAHVAQADVGDLLRLGGHQHDHVRAAFRRAADHDVAGEVEDLGPVDDVGAHGHRRVGVVERLVERDPLARRSTRSTRRSWWTQWSSTVVGSVGVTTTSSPTCQPVASSTVIVPSPAFASPVSRVHAVFGVPLAVEHAVADDPQADVLLDRLVGVPADEPLLVDVHELDLVHHRGVGRAQHEPAGDDEVAAGHQPPAAGGIEHERPAGLDARRR